MSLIDSFSEAYVAISLVVGIILFYNVYWVGHDNEELLEMEESKIFFGFMMMVVFWPVTICLVLRQIIINSRQKD